ncbi:bestrophin-like domain [Streptomyces sp. 3213.3]|uniref:bestrophin-like domain n=1 Tax=Streptomyces sp. 3213.3 TaxID=1855348 RepID=UPI003FA7F053
MASPFQEMDHPASVPHDGGTRRRPGGPSRCRCSQSCCSWPGRPPPRGCCRPSPVRCRSPAGSRTTQIAWYSRTLPQPDRGRLGAPAEQYTRTVIRTEWPLLGDQRDDPGAWRQFTEIRESFNTRGDAAHRL